MCRDIFLWRISMRYAPRSHSLILYRDIYKDELSISRSHRSSRSLVMRVSGHSISDTRAWLDPEDSQMHHPERYMDLLSISYHHSVFHMVHSIWEERASFLRSDTETSINDHSHGRSMLDGSHERVYDISESDANLSSIRVSSRSDSWSRHFSIPSLSSIMRMRISGLFGVLRAGQRSRISYMLREGTSSEPISSSRHFVSFLVISRISLVSLSMVDSRSLVGSIESSRIFLVHHLARSSLLLERRSMPDIDR